MERLSDERFKLLENVYKSGENGLVTNEDSDLFKSMRILSRERLVKRLSVWSDEHGSFQSFVLTASGRELFLVEQQTRRKDAKNEANRKRDSRIQRFWHIESVFRSWLQFLIAAFFGALGFVAGLIVQYRTDIISQLIDRLPF